VGGVAEQERRVQQPEFGGNVGDHIRGGDREFEAPVDAGLGHFQLAAKLAVGMHLYLERFRENRGRGDCLGEAAARLAGGGGQRIDRADADSAARCRGAKHAGCGERSRDRRKPAQGDAARVV
jgi:hypothetical protein